MCFRPFWATWALGPPTQTCPMQIMLDTFCGQKKIGGGGEFYFVGGGCKFFFSYLKKNKPKCDLGVSKHLTFLVQNFFVQKKIPQPESVLGVSKHLTFLGKNKFINQNAFQKIQSIFTFSALNFFLRFQFFYQNVFLGYYKQLNVFSLLFSNKS